MLAESLQEPDHGPEVRQWRYTAQTGEEVVKTFKVPNDDTRTEMTIVYDPDNPKRAWPPDNVFGRAFRWQVIALRVLGGILVIMGLLAFV